MNWNVSKAGTYPIYQKPAHAIGLSTPPIGCVLDLPGLPGGGSTIYDRSPYGNNGTITGATWTRLPSGLWVLSFDGTDDYVNGGAGASLNITSAITLEAWVRLTSTGGGKLIMKPSGSGWSSPYAYWALGANGTDHPEFWININTNAIVSPDVISVDTFYHLVGTFDGTTQRLYVDAVEKNTGGLEEAISTSAQPLAIGVRSTTSLGEYFTGTIALVRIYNRALSALEIQNHYQQERHLFGV